MTDHRADIDNLIADTLNRHEDADSRTKAAYISKALFETELGLRRIIEYLTAKGHTLD